MEDVKAFERWLRAGDEHRAPAAEATASIYRLKVQQFLTWRANQSESEITPALLYRYITHLAREERQRPRTIHQAFAALFRWFGYLEAECAVQGLPSRKAVRLPPLDQATRYTPTDDEVAAIWTAAERLPAHTPYLAFTRERSLTLLCVFRYVCIRNFEAQALNVGDIDLTQLRLYVAYGKGGKSDWLPIIAPLAEQLRVWLPVREKWLETRGKVNEEAGQALFPESRDARVGEAGIRNLFRTICRVGLGGDQVSRITPHCLRHYGLSSLHRLGVPDAYLSRIARHSSIRITQDAYIHTDEERLAAYLSRLAGDIHPREVQEQNVSDRPEPAREERHSRRREVGSARRRTLRGR